MKNNSNWSTYLNLLKFASRYWLFFVIGIIGTILAASTDATLAWSVKPFMDNWNVVTNHNKWWFTWLPLIIIAVLFLRGLSNFLSNYFLTCVGRNVVRDFRQRIFAHLMHLPVKYYDQESSGKLLSMIIYNTEQVASASTEALITVMQEGMLLISLIIVMIHLSWKLTLIFLTTAPIISAIIRYTSKRLRYLSTNVQTTMGDLTHVAEEGIENYKVVRIFGGEKYEKKKFFTVADRNRQRELKVVATSSIGTSLTQVITAFPIAVIIFFATSPFIHISLGSFGAFVVSILSLLTPLRRLTKVNTEIQKGIAGAKSIFNLLDEELEKDSGNKNIDRSAGNLEYKNVTFIYPRTKKAVIKNISFKIEPLQNIAIVGRSGSGKSTLINLLPRFYEITNGQILIDGENIKNYKLTDLRKQFSMVSQNLTLFNDTIARNIAYGSLQDTTDENKILKAADSANILTFIKTLPNGLNTIIGENGLLLSGGQRQRIAIARALLKNAPFLILDEATSALDTESERYIQEALKNLMKKCTTIIIAHRLSTVEHADKIIVLDRGSIVEVGTHLELLKLKGHYAKLYNIQFKESA